MKSCALVFATNTRLSTLKTFDPALNTYVPSKYRSFVGAVVVAVAIVGCSHFVLGPRDTAFVSLCAAKRVATSMNPAAGLRSALAAADGRGGPLCMVTRAQRREGNEACHANAPQRPWHRGWERHPKVSRLGLCTVISLTVPHGSVSGSARHKLPPHAPARLGSRQQNRHHAITDSP